MVKELVPQLEKDGHVTRGWLGVTIQKLTPELAESIGVEPERTGSSSAASRPTARRRRPACEPGDVIQQLNGKAVEDPAALATAVAGTAMGKTVPVEVKRDGRPRPSR